MTATGSSPQDFSPALSYFDITDLINNAAELQRLAVRRRPPPGSTAWNRRHFLKMAETEWARFHRYHRPLAMLMVDIDNFKNKNDRLGHAAGDHAIKWVATACTMDQRSTDIVGRIGGDEFALILPERMKCRLASSRSVFVEGQRLAR